MPFYHARLPVYSWMSGSVNANMYNFDEHTVWIGTTDYWDKKVYLPLSLLLTPLSARRLAHCGSSYMSSFPSHLQLSNYLMYSAGSFEEMQNKNFGGLMPLNHMLWYCDKYVVDCENIDAVVVVDETPTMAATIAMSNARTKVAFLAVSAIKQKELSSTIGGALQHTIILRYMLVDDQMEQRVTGATRDTQEPWLLGIPPWVWDSYRGHEGHQTMHAAEAVKVQIVSLARVDDSECTTTKPAPTLPKLKKTAEVVPFPGTAAESGTLSSSKKQAKEEAKELDTCEETDDEDNDKEEEEEDLDQVLETQQKQKPAPTSHVEC